MKKWIILGLLLLVPVAAYASDLIYDRTVLPGNTSLSGAMNLNGYIEPASLSVDTHNYNPAGLSEASVLVISASVAIDLTGIQAPSPAVGKFLLLINEGPEVIGLVNESASSTAANRFEFNSSPNIAADECVTLWYHPTDMRWHMVGSYF